MNKIDIKEYFIEIIDEGRSTIGYDCVPYKTNELVHKIYKQNGELKRLEKENAELKERYKKYKRIFEEINPQTNYTTKAFYTAEEYKRLEQENAELKAKFNNNSLCNKIQIYEADEARMRKALEEIREIAKENYYSCSDCEKQRKELNCNDKCNAYRLNEIQRKINEVIGND